MLEVLLTSLSPAASPDYRVVSLVIALFAFTYHKEGLYVVKTVNSALGFLIKRRNIPPVYSAPFEAWPEPPETLFQDDDSNNNNNNNRKIIWGFWDGGEANMPGFCGMAVESWRIRHPDWTIIILSDDTFKSYVSPTEIPSTFYSLKPQYRSDLIRVAVLRRYGGIYLDASYTLYRSLDDMWDEAKRKNDLYLTTLVTLQDDFHLPNNCLLVCPNPQNPLLVAWQALLLKYLERPLTSPYVADICRHPSFQRVKSHFDDPALGGFGLVIAYHSVLWTLADVLYYESSVRDYVKQHVYVLPSYRWTFDIIMCMAMHYSDKEVLTGFCNNESIWEWFKRLPMGVRVNHRDEPHLSERFLSLMCAMKISSDFCHDFGKPKEFHVSRGSTLSRIYKASIDDTLLPVKQADMIGARLIIPRT